MARENVSREFGGAEEFLSPLEYDVACVLWGCPAKQLKVREIHAQLKKSKRGVPLTSVAVMLDRLHGKGIVSRTAEPGLGGYHYIYSTKASKKEFEQSLLANAVDRLIENFGSSAVAYFNERFSK